MTDRRAFPDIVLYRVEHPEHGTAVLTLPPIEGSYFIQVLDLEAYERLCATGEIRDSYPKPGELVDRRMTG